MTPPPMRAGDSDRAAIVDLLRAHHLDGRLTVEEFEERTDRAQVAVTLLELGALHEDLPELTPRRGKMLQRSTRAPRIPGRMPFVERVELPATPDHTRQEAFGSIAPPMTKLGYRMSITGSSLQFRRRRRPVWTIVLAILVFPVGLLALLHTADDEVAVEIEARPGGGTVLVAHGVGSLAVRRAFAQIS